MAKCCDYNSGLLKTSVAFERATKTANGSGGYTEAWGAISGSQSRAYVKAMSGSERYASDRVEATARYRVVCRYFSGLLESDSIVINSRRHNIRFIDNIEYADKWLSIDVDQGVAV